ncbi:MAG: multidrug effflux MFS transporter [Alphaproteobacteria bacterium]|nr:multidrug effflux MFS transporter [Rhizobiaceae bacterium]MBU3960727.1 multidrug effflux MFS transporter [Alphaproteobacteria bacterium]MBU4049801.1 multidrug effflux MFS transporter [Alphaproteobacteria bacterium]MBU4090433.1 multidrug effflux MFS transporter [Alphaproteobacteria bacterium]MBU4155108.1 multidrug effflux MFS transporter [Alphaproteobacteria bacterium]
MKTARFLDRRSPPHIVTLVAIAGLSALTMNIFLPSLPSMAKDFGVTYGTIQILISGYIAMTAVVQIAIGPLSDRFGRRPTVIGSLVILLVATLVCMVATDIYTLVVARMLQTAVVAGIVLSRAIVRDMVPMEEAASMIGYVTMGMTIVPMIGPTLGGVLGDAFGWRANFVAIFALGVVVLSLVAADLGETNRNRSASFSAQFKAWPGLLASPQFWGYTAVVTFTSGAFFAFLGGTPFIGATLMHMSPSTLGLQFIFIAAGYMAGNFVSGRYARRYGTSNMMLAGTIAMIVGTLIPAAFLLAGVGSALAFFGPQVIVGFGNGLTLPSANAGVVSVKPHLAGSASGLSGAIAMGGGAGTSVFASSILTVETGAMPMLLVMLACGVLAVAAILYLRYGDPQVSE